jgi:hypothetical protein
MAAEARVISLAEGEAGGTPTPDGAAAGWRRSLAAMAPGWPC